MDYIPDECSEYYETNLLFENFMKGMKVTHRWCPDTRQMQPVGYFRAKLDRELRDLYTDLGGEA